MAGIFVTVAPSMQAYALSEVLVRTLRQKSLRSPSYQLQCQFPIYRYGAAESQTSQVGLEFENGSRS